jgi:integrase
MNAEWRHVNMEARTWYLPDSKNQRDHTIHLSEFAMVQVRGLLALRESTLNEAGVTVLSPWLFPNTSGKGPLDSKTLQKQLHDRQRLGANHLTGRTKLTDILWINAERDAGKWTCHDLRRSAATLMARLGIGDDVINQALNHKLQGISGVYLHDRRLPQQALAFDALGAKLAELVTGKAAASNVVPLPVQQSAA